MTGRVFVDYWLDDLPVTVGAAVGDGKLSQYRGIRAIAVGRALARHATWKTGRDARPSTLTLSAETLYGEKPVRGALKDLDAVGLSIVTGRAEKNVAVRTLLRPQSDRHPECRTGDDSVRHPQRRTDAADEYPVRSIPAVSPVDSGSQSGTLSADNLRPPKEGGGGNGGDEVPSPSPGQVLLRDVGQRVRHHLDDRRTSRLVKTADRLAAVGWDVDSLDEAGWLDALPKIDDPRAFFATRLAGVPDTPGTPNPKTQTPTKTKPRTPTKTTKPKKAPTDRRPVAARDGTDIPPPKRETHEERIRRFLEEKKRENQP